VDRTAWLADLDVRRAVSTPHLAPPVSEAAFGCAWLNARGAVATAEVIVACTDRDATIKRPNDVCVDSRKVDGIPVERAPATSKRRRVRTKWRRTLAAVQLSGSV
jgi:biotin-(acetyl-CoA carboxylase) ligase